VDSYQNAAQLAALTQPQDPVFCIRPHAAQTAARWFLTHFPGETFYAVKANPSPWLLRTLYEAGVTRFEVASIAEVRLIAELFPDATIAFMHPVKAREAIAEAYHQHGVRTFSLDNEDELEKILAATGHAQDLTLCVRLAVSNDHAKISLARKFGASGADAVRLLQKTRLATPRLGVAFHVGSQTMSPDAYVAAIDTVEQVVVQAGVIVDVLDVGGGFPSAYPGMFPPPLENYAAAIKARFEKMLVAENCVLWCEPGRALSAESSSLIVRVEARKGGSLHLNEGVYGALFDAGHLKWPFPVGHLAHRTQPTELAPFSFYGPTCDDLDFIEGPYHLPSDVKAGDYLEVGMLGAYGVAMRTGFNGFAAYREIKVNDAPMLSVYKTNDPLPAIGKEAANVQ